MDALIEYVEQLQYIYPKLEGRLTVIQFQNDDVGRSIRLVIIFLASVVLMLMFYYIYITYWKHGYQYQRLDI